MRILLVEDDRDLADYVRRGLEEESHVVEVCYDGASGLRAAERAAFDMIVLDVMLPFMDGLEVTRRLRLWRVKTPILLLTARDSFLEGRFFEKVLFEESVRDPFGNESTFERLTYREVEFTFSTSYPQVELRKFPRNTQAFVTRTAEVTDFGTTFIPVSVDAFSWADKIRAAYPKQFRIDLAQLSEVSIEENVFARVVLSSPHDIRAAFGRFTNSRQHRVDRIQVRLEYADELVSFQLAADGTLRSADALPAEVLDAVRQALPGAGAQK